MPEPLYDRIGGTYAASRREDPRIARAVRAALGDATSVVNVGAGTGSYEPADLHVVPVEPSARMVEQRPASRAPALLGTADALPLEAASVDAAMAILSDHHWPDRRAGLAELRRVARRRVVLVNADPAAADDFWLTRDYLPGFHDLIPPRFRDGSATWADELREALGPCEMTPLPVPHDCADGFYAAYWRRPAAYLDPAVRANVSVFARLPADEVTAGLARLADDLATGRWAERNADLLTREEADVGLRVVVAELRPDRAT